MKDDVESPWSSKSTKVGDSISGSVTEIDTQIESDNDLKFKSCEKSKWSVTTPLRLDKSKINAP